MIIWSFLSAIERKVLEFNNLILKMNILRWNKPKPKTSQVSCTKWKKVAYVSQLYVYPLIAGTSTFVQSCVIRNSGLVGNDDGISIRNRLFVVYDELTGIVQTDKEIRNFTKISICFQNRKTIILKCEDESENMKEIRLMPREFTDSRMCMMSYAGELIVQLRVENCGTQATALIRRFTGNERLCLGRVNRDYPVEKTFTYEYNKRCDRYLDRRGFSIPFENIPAFTLLTHRSLREIENISSVSVTSQLKKLRPNMVISLIDDIPFTEMKWQRIKIGDVIVNNIKPWNSSESPISFADIPLHIKKKEMLLHCEVLQQGVVKQGDKVYILEKENNQL